MSSPNRTLKRKLIDLEFENLRSIPYSLYNTLENENAILQEENKLLQDTIRLYEAMYKKNNAEINRLNQQVKRLTSTDYHPNMYPYCESFNLLLFSKERNKSLTKENTDFLEDDSIYDS
jgi:hypothetical protein